MKKIILMILFVFLLTSSVFAAWKSVPKDFHDQEDLVFDYYEEGGSGGSGSSEWAVNSNILAPNATNSGVDLSVGRVLYVDDSAQRVGIGSTAPVTPLYVEGNGVAGSYNTPSVSVTSLFGVVDDEGDNFWFEHETGGDGVWLRSGINNSGYFGFATRESAVNLERMRIYNNGDIGIDTDTLFVDASTDRVGIGTTTPAAPLDILHSASSAGQETLKLRNSHASGKAGIEFYNDAGTTVGFIASYGSSAVSPLADNAAFGAINDIHMIANGNVASGGSNDAIISAGGYNSEVARFTSTGRVGIGTASPTAGYIMETNGSVLIDGDLSVGNDVTITDTLWFSDGTSMDTSPTVSIVWDRDEVDNDFVLSPSIANDSVEIDGDLTVNGNAYLSQLGYGSMTLQGDLTAQGNIYGVSPSLSMTGNATISRVYMRGGHVWLSANTATLPAIEEGDVISFTKTTGGASIIDSNGSDKFWIDGTATDDGDTIDLTILNGKAVCKAYPTGSSPEGLWCDTGGAGSDGGAT